MTEPPDQLLGELDKQPKGASLEVEELLRALPRAPVGKGLTLSGNAALDVRDSLGSLAIESVNAGRRAFAETSFRLVPSEATAQGLADGSLRWATAKKGDASVLIKNTKTGRIAGQGQLEQVRPSPAKVLGPAAWEAMAMATQQHYLVEINEKLESVAKGVDEVLARMDDEKSATLLWVRRAAAGSRDRWADGKTLSGARVAELHDGAQNAERVWHELHTRMKRHLREYQAGIRAVEEVEQSWAMLLHATQVLGECSAVLTAVPYETVEALEDATSEARERVLHAVDSVRELAGEFHAVHLVWAQRKTDAHYKRLRKPVRTKLRAAARKPPVMPAQKPLDLHTAWRISQLASPPQPPKALLVTMREDGTVEVAPEPVTAGRLA